MSHLEILQSALNRKKEENPLYSNNAFARDLNISGAFFSSIINGKKEIPHHLLLKIFEKLNFDDYTKNNFLKKLLFSKFDRTLFKNTLLLNEMMNNYDFLPLLEANTSLIKKWYYLPILEYLSCKNFSENIDDIASTFEIERSEVLETFLVLETSGIIFRNKDGRLEKKEQFLRVTTKESHSTIRDFHSKMIDIAKNNLNNKTSETDYKKRLISGITIAVNEDQVELCKNLIEDALHNISTQLTKGDCTKVYQFNVQLFPLSN